MATTANWSHKPFATTAAILLACCTLAFLQTRERPSAELHYHSPTEIIAAAAGSRMSGAVFLRPRFLLFGDSLTERSLSGERGWAASLAHTYFRKVCDDGWKICRKDIQFVPCGQTDYLELFPLLACGLMPLTAISSVTFPAAPVLRWMS